MVNEKIRVFHGATELTAFDLKYTKSDDQVVDKAEMEIVSNSGLDRGSIVDFRKSDGVTNVFSPKVISIKKSTTWKVFMLSRGYELNNIRVEKVYENYAPEDIVEDIITNFTQNLTYASTATSGVTISKYIAKAYAIDIIYDMMVLLDWQIRIDSSDNFYFESRGNIDKGKVFTFGGSSGNIHIDGWEEDDTTKVNKIKIIGQTVYPSTNESSTASAGQTTIVLTHKPSGPTKLKINSVEKVMGLEGGTGYYTLDSVNKTINLNSALTGGEVISVDYAYDLPIVVVDQDDGSLNSDEEIFREVSAPFIDNFADARRYARNLLETYSNGEIKANGYSANFDFDREVGEIVTIIDTLRNRTAQLVIRKITYVFSENKTEYEFGSRDYVFFDWQREVQDRIKKLERRLQEEEEEVFARTIKSKCTVSMKVMQNSEFNYPVDSFIPGHETLGYAKSNLNKEIDCSTNGNHGTWQGTGIDGSQFGFTDVFTNLVAYWKFNEGEGTTVYDFKGNLDGTSIDLSYTSGKFGYSGDFNGSTSKIDMAVDSGPFSGTDSISVEMWLKTNSTTQSYLVQQRDSTSTNGQWAVQLMSTGHIKFWDYDSGAYGFNTQSSAIINDNLWHHIVFVRDSDISKGYYYIDSIQDSEITPLSLISYSTLRDFAIGYNKRDNDQYADVSFGLIRLYNGKLTPEQVKELYNLSGRTNSRLSYGIFNGTDNYISVADSSDLDGGANMSLTFSLNPNSLAKVNGVLNKIDSTNGYNATVEPDGSVQFLTKNSGVISRAISTETIDITKFYNVGIVKTGYTIDFYFDGIPDTSKQLLTSDVDVWLKFSEDSGTTSFDSSGNWNNAITQRNISSMTTTMPSGKCFRFNGVCGDREEIHRYLLNDNVASTVVINDATGADGSSVRNTSLMNNGSTVYSMSGSKMMYFNGTDYISLGSIGNPTVTVSVEAEIMADDIVNDTQNIVVKGNNDYPAINGVDFQFGVDLNGKLFMDWNNGSWHTITSTGGVSPGALTKVAVVYDSWLSSNNVKFYINGALDSQFDHDVADGTSLPNNTSTWFIGGLYDTSPGSLVGPFVGHIANVKISTSRVFGPNELNRSYNNGSSTDDLQDYLTLGSNSVMNLTSGCGLSFWMKTSNTMYTNLFSKDKSPSLGFLGFNNQTNRWKYEPDNNNFGGDSGLLSTTISDGNAHHYVHTWIINGANVDWKIYVDSVLQSSISHIKPTPNDTFTIKYIGTSGSLARYVYGEALKADLRDIRIFNDKLLNQTEVDSIYNSGLYNKFDLFTGSQTTNVGINTNNFEFGRVGSVYFDGKGDEIKLFTDSLTPTEVNNINNKINITDNQKLWISMDNPTPGDKSTLKREWSNG